MADNGRVIALGFFDGVHIGHGALLDTAKARARAEGLSAAALTFDVPPVKTVEGGQITSAPDRADALRRIWGVGELIVLHFDEALMRMEWPDFIELLYNDYSARRLVAGYDFRFGYKGEGDADKLRSKCAELGVGCDIVPAVRMDGAPVSSTRVRSALLAGDIEGANRLLGHRYFLTDTVREGRRLGRRLGRPTVNMRFEAGVLVPLHGVYVAEAIIVDTNERYRAVTNIGERPTVSGEGSITVESHLLGFSGSLYGRRVRVELIAFLRPEREFGSVDELKEQIRLDTAAAEAYFEAVENRA